MILLIVSLREIIQAYNTVLLLLLSTVLLINLFTLIVQRF